MSTGKAAKRLGVSVKTLQRWEREGRLIPVARTDSHRRLYTETQLREFIGWRQAPERPKRLVADCRVSSKAQKPDLANQRRVLEAFSSRLSGLRHSRKTLNEALSKDQDSAE